MGDKGPNHRGACTCFHTHLHSRGLDSGSIRGRRRLGCVPVPRIDISNPRTFAQGKGGILTSTPCWAGGIPTVGFFAALFYIGGERFCVEERPAVGKPGGTSQVHNYASMA